MLNQSVSVTRAATVFGIAIQIVLSYFGTAGAVFFVSRLARSEHLLESQTAPLIKIAFLLPLFSFIALGGLILSYQRQHSKRAYSWHALPVVAIAAYVFYIAWLGGVLPG